MPLNSAGPVTVVSLATRWIIDWAGVTHGPPLPAHPGPDPRMILIPSRSASFTACL